ncbi:MAG: hypothetical protein ACREOV_12080, partial [Candidatus Dormibacteraceae bacterium]
MALADLIWRPRVPLHVEAGLEITGHSAWAWTQVPLITHSLVDPRLVLREVQRHVRLLNRAQTGRWHLQVLPMPLSPEVPVAALRGVREQPIWDRYQASTQSYLATSELRSRVVLLGYELGERRESGWRTLRRLGERAVGAEGSVDDPELERWRRRLKTFLVASKAQIPGLEAARAGLISWSIWRNYWRGCESEDEAPPLDDRPTAGDEARALINGLVQRRLDHVLLGDRGQVRCSFLSVSHLPYGREFGAGFDWLFRPDALGFPSECQVRFELHPTAQA